MADERFEAVWDGIELDKTAPLDVRATIGSPAADWRDTLRSSLPVIPVGSHLDSQFQIERLLGRGGMGVVHLAHQSALGRDVAIKTVSSDRVTRAAENALLQEARAMGLVEHPNVVPVHLIGQDGDGRPVIVMKRIDGTAWSAFIDGTSTPDSEDPLGFHLGVVIAICRAIEFAHDRGVVHRDIKPENVMIGRFGEVYVLDWGLAASLEPSSRHLPFVGDDRSTVGTPAYMPPEMVIGNGPGVGRTTDVFLIGASLFHALTGAPPNRGRSLFEVMSFSYMGGEREYPPGLSAELVSICERAMAHDAAARYPDAAALRRALDAFLAHRASHALVDTAQLRLASLRDALLVDEADSVHELFGEARFGFVSALAVWDENEEARRGLQDALCLMIDFELLRNNVTSARDLLAQLPWPDPELAERIEQLDVQLRERASRLEKLAYDYDDSVGLVARRWIVGSMALMFALTPIFLRVVERWTVPPSLRFISDDPVLLVANGLGFTFIPLLVIFALFVWRRFRDHKTSRTVVTGFLGMYLLGFGARTTSIWAGVPLHLAAAGEAAVFASGLLMLGLALDLRFLWPGLILATATAPLIIFPGHTVDIYAGAEFLGCTSFLLYDALLASRSSSSA